MSFTCYIINKTMKNNSKTITLIINGIAFLLTVYTFYRFINAKNVSDTFPFLDPKEIGIITTLAAIINGLVYFNRSRQK